MTLMIDVASRPVPGFHLDLLAPSAVAVAMCMRHAVLPIKIGSQSAALQRPGRIMD